MYSFLVDFIDYAQTGTIRFFLLFFFVIWLRWFVVRAFSYTYKPYVEPYRTKTSAIIPVVDEPLEVFRAVLESLQSQRVDQIIVVINGPRNRSLERICKQLGGIETHWTKVPGKRNAIRIGMQHVVHPITILVDSDTIWTEDTLKELMKPFKDRNVGGVTTRQQISNPKDSLLNRFCDWMEEVRSQGTMPAMSTVGQVGCLPGRTIAFRTTILRNILPEFMTETFLGVHKEVSDDRALTNLTLMAGYKTVLQATSVVRTEAPRHWRQFIRQQIRWSEGSQYNNVKMSPWMLKNAPLMFFIFWTDTLIPFMLWAMYGSFLLQLTILPEARPAPELFGISSLTLIIIATLLGALVSYSVRQLHIINQRRWHVFFIPIYLMLMSFLMAPIRIIGFAKIADNISWGTRKLTNEPAAKREPTDENTAATMPALAMEAFDVRS